MSETFSKSGLCSHSGVTQVIEIGKGIVLAGSFSDFEREIGMLGLDLLLNLSKQHLSEPFELNKYATGRLPRRDYPAIRTFNVPTMIFDWPDMGIPRVGQKFWIDMARYVEKGNVVGVHCMGGHGRTGTALCALALAARVETPDIIAAIRKTYCNKAVESEVQIKYLQRVMGARTNSKPSNGGGSGAASWWPGKDTSDEQALHAAINNPEKIKVTHPVVSHKTVTKENPGLSNDNKPRLRKSEAN